jgi:hypothetical protein
MGEASTKNEEHKLSNHDKVRMVSSTREILQDLFIGWLGVSNIEYLVKGI